jgi:3-oxoadipate enol-lactonase
MPYQKINGAQIYYEEHGDGPETIFFSHGLLWSGYMFHNQIAVLKDRYRCITYDHRGQGQTEVTRSGYDIESLYDDAIALIDTLDCAPCHFMGLSMGGFVGLRVGIRRPDLLKSLTIMESSSDTEAHQTRRQYRLLSIVAYWIGLRVVADRVMEIMFGQKFLNDPERAKLKDEWKERMVANDRVGITRAVSGIITREGISEQLDQIRVPTLIIVGDQDVATVPAKAEKMHASIPNSKLVIIPDAGHTSTIEEPEAVTAALVDFFK